MPFLKRRFGYQLFKHSSSRSVVTEESDDAKKIDLWSEFEGYVDDKKAHACSARLSVPVINSLYAVSQEQLIRGACASNHMKKPTAALLGYTSTFSAPVFHQQIDHNDTLRALYCAAYYGQIQLLNQLISELKAPLNPQQCVAALCFAIRGVKKSSVRAQRESCINTLLNNLELSFDAYFVLSAEAKASRSKWMMRHIETKKPLASERSHAFIPYPSCV